MSKTNASQTWGIGHPKSDDVDVSMKNGWVQFQSTDNLWAVNSMGHVQGGFLAAMLDDTLGPALAATLARGQFAPTLQLSVTFLRPAKIGLLQGTGRVVRRGREVCHLAGELRQDGEVVASALATALVRQAAPGDKPTPPFTPGADHVAP